MKLLLIRHGEIPSNVYRIYAGGSPEGLTERGVCQAVQVSEKLINYEIDALYSSPVQRALQTANIIAEKTGMEVKVDDAFREMEMGPWEGMPEDDVARDYPHEWNIWNNRPADLKLPGRETLNELLDRVLAGVRNVCREAAGSSAVIVTHVAIIRVLLLWKEGRSLNLYKTIHVPNAEIYKIIINNL